MLLIRNFSILNRYETFCASVCCTPVGVSTCHFAWAFHYEAEEEMLNMIPAMQRGDPQWSELRAVGVGWWIRNINTLRRMVEKVGHILQKTTPGTYQQHI